MEWISVKDKLPENHEVVMVSNGNSITVAQAYYNINNDFSWQVKTNKSDLWDEDGYGITHWMPLPPPPEE